MPSARFGGFGVKMAANIRLIESNMDKYEHLATKTYKHRSKVILNKTPSTTSTKVLRNKIFNPKAGGCAVLGKLAVWPLKTRPLLR